MKQNDLGRTLQALLGGVKPTAVAPGGFTAARPVKRKTYNKDGKTESELLSQLAALFRTDGSTMGQVKGLQLPAQPTASSPQLMRGGMPDALAPDPLRSGNSQPLTEEVSLDMLMGRTRATTPRQ